MGEQRIATLFGGAGFIGRYVVQRLAKAGWILRIAGREAEKAAQLKPLGAVGQIIPLSLSITDEQRVAQAVAGATAVVNLVGILFERRWGDFDRLHYRGAERIARLAAAAGVTSLVHVSALGADATSPSRYAQSKAAGEEAVRAAFPAATILRPSVVFGAEDQFFNRFAALARLLPALPVIGGTTRLQPVYVGDVADAVVAALTRPEARGQVYELGGPRVMTMQEVMAFVLTATGRRRWLIPLPWGLARAMAWLGEWLPVRPPLTRDQLLLLSRDNIVAAGALGLAELGIRPKAVEAVVPSYVARFRPGGWWRPWAGGG